MIDKKFVLVAVALLAVPAVSAIALPSGAREKAGEIRQENVQLRKDFVGNTQLTKTQSRENWEKMWETLKATNAVEIKNLKVTGAQEWQYLQKRRLEEIEKAKADGLTPGELQEINKKYVELGKTLKATFKPERKELRVTNFQERKDVRVTIRQERKDMYTTIGTERKTMQEQVKSNWQNFWGMFKPKPTVTAMPTVTQ